MQVPTADTCHISLLPKSLYMHNRHTIIIIVVTGNNVLLFKIQDSFIQCVLVYCFVVNVQPCFNFSDEIIFILFIFYIIYLLILILCYVTMCVYKFYKLQLCSSFCDTNPSLEVLLCC